jgi:phosphohistidine swiveling domain-containing protein
VKTYVVLEEESGAHLYPFYFLSRINRSVEKMFESSVRNFLFYQKDGRFKLGAVEDEWARQGKIVLDKVLSDPGFAEETFRNIRTLNSRLYAYSEKVLGADLSAASNDELLRMFTGFYDVLDELYAWGLVSEFMEVHHSMFSKYLEGYLAKRIRERKIGKSAGECLALLVTPVEETFTAKQEREFLAILRKLLSMPEAADLFASEEPGRILSELQNKREHAELNGMIKGHVKAYAWINYNYEGPAVDELYFTDLLFHAVKAHLDPESKLRELEGKSEETKQRQESLLEELAPDEQHLRLLDNAREFSTLKALRKEHIFHASYAMDRLREEIIKRLGITLNQSRCMLVEEIAAALRGKSIDRRELEAREEELAWLLEDGRQQILAGERARELSKLFAEVEVTQADEVKGSCASPGKAKGTVRIIAHVEDMTKMREGDVLVSNATNPNYVPAMKKAAAIITDMGGITCHAAIVSREFGIPCVVGTRVATKVFKDGDIVEVDAANGVVKKVSA